MIGGFLPVCVTFQLLASSTAAFTVVVRALRDFQLPYQGISSSGGPAPSKGQVWAGTVSYSRRPVLKAYRVFSGFYRFFAKLM